MNRPIPQVTLPNFDKMWNYGDPAETEQRFRAILPRAEVSHDVEYLAQLLTQIARCEGLQGKFQASHSTLDTVEKLMSLNNLRLAKVRYLLERGRAFNSSGKPEAAKPLFLSAYELADHLGEARYAIDAVHMVAIAEPDPKDQVEWNLKGIAMCEADPTQKGWLHALLNNIGESYLAIKDYSRAYQSFHRLAQLQKESQGKADKYTVKDEAKALRLGGDAEKSLELIEPILKSLLDEGQDDGYIRQEYAEALYAVGRVNEAKPHFSKAFELLSIDSWAAQNDVEGIERAKRLSE